MRASAEVMGHVDQVWDMHRPNALVAMDLGSEHRDRRCNNHNAFAGDMEATDEQYTEAGPDAHLHAWWLVSPVLQSADSSC